MFSATASLPVISSPVGVNRQILEGRAYGRLADDEREFRAAIESYYREREHLSALGESARERVRRDFSLDAWAPRLKHLLLGERASAAE